MTLTDKQARKILGQLFVDSDGHIHNGGYASEALKDALEVAVKSLEFGQKVSLNDLMSMQRELMNLLGIPNKLVGNPVNSPLYKDTLIMLAGEVQEALEPCTISSKPWKHKAPSELLAETTDEVIDVFFFVMEAFLMLGLTPEQVAARYEEKRELIINTRLNAATSG